jgi:catechol 2,3-dioxygenase-like lactoylglutathione lyase family enzyme
MKRNLAALTLLVRDYDEAIAHYTRVFGFELIEDSPRPYGKRWVKIATGTSPDSTCLLLAKAVTDEQIAQIGHQSGGRVFLFLHTDDFARDHARLAASDDIRFCETPRDEAYGKVVVFEDLYGNRWDLIQPASGLA